MKPGDLVTYNAAGMKYKTLGLIMDIAFRREFIGKPKAIYLIQWCVTGKFMPRRENNPTDPGSTPWNWESPKSGDLVWHSNEGKWFEVIK